MWLERAVDRSTAIRLARQARARLAARFAPFARRLSAVDRRLVRVVRGSWLYRWLTTEPDPEPVVIDLRETCTVGPILAVLDCLAPVVARSWLARTASGLADRIAAAPVRTAGVALNLAFAASLLGTLATDGLTWLVYSYHALGLLAGLAALRDDRPPDALAESPFWSAVIAVFAPPPAPDDEADG